MNLMECRLASLQTIFQGFLKTKVPLIEYHNETLQQAFLADDIGIYTIIPQLAYHFNLPLEQTITYFFYTLLIAPLFIGLAGLYKCYTTPIARIVCAFALTYLARKAYWFGDTYLAYYAAVVIIIPWALYFLCVLNKKSTYENIWLFSSGFLAVCLHMIRSYSSAGALLFLLLLMIIKRSKKELCTNILLLMLGASCSYSYFWHAHTNSLRYAQEHLEQGERIGLYHTFWHTIYAGFGLLHVGNSKNIIFSDLCVEQHAQVIDPAATIFSLPHYESVVKKNILDLWHNHKEFIFFTIFAKIGIIFWYLIFFAHFGLLAAFLAPKPWYHEAAFFLSFSFYALFPLLATPLAWHYALGFISTSVLYAITSINHAFETLDRSYGFSSYCYFLVSRLFKRNKEYV